MVTFGTHLDFLAEGHPVFRSAGVLARLRQSCGIELTIRDTSALRLILIFEFDAPLGCPQAGSLGYVSRYQRGAPK